MLRKESIIFQGSVERVLGDTLPHCTAVKGCVNFSGTHLNKAIKRLIMTSSMSRQDESHPAL